ncbi:MAG: hypothetical protein ACHQRJ_03730 [Alphaproteobacteria bacterium]
MLEAVKPYTLSPAAVAAVERATAVLALRADIAAAIGRVKAEAAEASAAHDRARAHAETLRGDAALEAASRVVEGAGVVASLKSAGVAGAVKKGLGAAFATLAKDLEAATLEMRNAEEMRKNCEAVLDALARKEADANMELLEATKALRDVAPSVGAEMLRQYRVELHRVMDSLASVIRLGFALSAATTSTALGRTLLAIAVSDPAGGVYDVLNGGRYQWKDDPQQPGYSPEDLQASWKKDGALTEIFERLSPVRSLQARLESELRKMPGWIEALNSFAFQQRRASAAVKPAA